MNRVARISSLTTLHRSPRRRRDACRSGIIFVTALVSIMILMGLLASYTQEMGEQITAAQDHTSQVEADAIELGAEQYVLAAVDSNPGDAQVITSFPAEGVTMGNGYFWLLSPNQQTDQEYSFGIVDECGKINLNTQVNPNSTVPQANMEDVLSELPGMTGDLVEYILEWIGNSQAETDLGDYYSSLPIPYETKGARFETLEELNLVENDTGMTWDQLLFGLDANRDRVIDSAEASSGNGITLNFSGGSGVNGRRGLFDDLTVYSADPNTNAAGERLANINSTSVTSGPNVYILQTPGKSGGRSGRGTRATTYTINQPAWTTLYQQYGISLTQSMITTMNNHLATGGHVFRNLFSFYENSGLSEQQFNEVDKGIQAPTPNGAGYSRHRTGLVNIDTASPDVLYALAAGTGGIVTDSDVQALLAARQGADLSGMAWAFSTLAGLSNGTRKGNALAPLITDRSYQYSADIVAVSNDGHAFKRVRIVVDSSNPSEPATVVYRRDLTSYGWPLPAWIRQDLRAGQQLPTSEENGTLPAD